MVRWAHVTAQGEREEEEIQKNIQENHRLMNHWDWKRPSRSTSPDVNLMLPRPQLNHVPSATSTRLCNPCSVLAGSCPGWEQPWNRWAPKTPQAGPGWAWGCGWAGHRAGVCQGWVKRHRTWQSGRCPSPWLDQDGLQGAFQPKPSQGSLIVWKGWYKRWDPFAGLWDKMCVHQQCCIYGETRRVGKEKGFTASVLKNSQWRPDITCPKI